MLSIVGRIENTDRSVAIEVRAECGNDWYQVDEPLGNYALAMRRTVELVEQAPEARGHLRLRARATTTTVTAYAGTLMEV